MKLLGSRCLFPRMSTHFVRSARLFPGLEGNPRTQGLVTIVTDNVTLKMETVLAIVEGTYVRVAASSALRSKHEEAAMASNNKDRWQKPWTFFR